MKKSIFITCITLLSTFALQAQQIPSKEFTLSVSEKNIIVQPGDTKKYDVTINRSKSYKKTPINLLMESTLPEGVSVSFKDGTDPMINQIMIVSVAESAQPFKKAVILKGKSTRASKGVMLNLSVASEAYTSN